jgi:putative restriction endonuclease
MAAQEKLGESNHPCRRGQGLFKDRVSQIESRCRITGVQNPVHLVASHCKPWRDSTNEERLNGENGLL